MKLRNIFTMLTAALAFTFVGCEQQEQFLEEVKVSKSYISLPVGGGEEKIEVDAVADWSIVAWDAEAMKEVELPEWLTVEPASGSKGKTDVVFSAGETTESREVLLHLNCGVACQMLNVVQITEVKEPEISTCKWIAENAKDGVVYRAKGVVTIVNPTYSKYGGFTIKDDTGTLAIYGSDTKTMYPDLAVGDEVVVDGPWDAKHNNFNNGSQIVSLSKSLIKVEKVSPTELAADGDVFTVTLTSKGEKVTVSIPEEDQTWLSAGEPLVLGTTVVVELTALANASTPRTTTVSFSTVSGGKTYTATVEINQDGAVPQKTIAEAVASNDLGMVIGKVLYVHAKGVLITDGTDVLYGYLGSQPEVAVGDVVSMIGIVTLYKGGRSMNAPTIARVDATVPSYSAPSPVTLDATKFAELTGTSADFATPYVTITGVAEVDNYNNIIVKLVDGETTYSVKSYYHPESFADFKDKQVKVTGYAYNAYSDTKQVNLLVTSVKEANAPLPTIAEVLAAGAASGVETKGIVVATYTKGALINDGTGYILLYKNALLDVAVGDEVKVEGTTSKYNDMLQFAKDGLVVTKLSSGNTVTRPTPTALDGAGMDAIVSATSVQYIEYVGTLSVSGNYYNVAVEGAVAAQGSLQYIDVNAHPAAVHGAKIKVRGYFIGASNGKYVNTMTVSVEAVN